MAFIGRMMRARALRSAAPPAPLWEPQTSGLMPQQLAAGAKALQLLRLDDHHNQLTLHDMLCFLRAAGLVRTRARGTRWRLPAAAASRSRR